MTTLTLHKLPEGFIVTSDEQAKEGELGYIPFQGGDIKTVGKYFADDWKKVIVQQDQIDFSALKEEEQKEIEYFDVEKLAKEATNKQLIRIFGGESREEVLDDIQKRKFYFTKGFEKALELLSDRRFTLDDMIDCFNSAREYRMKNVFAYDEARDYIQSLQPKSWTIEVEMGEYSLNSDGEPIGFPDMSKPKFTNGKLKVTKIL